MADARASKRQEPCRSRRRRNRRRQTVSSLERRTEPFVRGTELSGNETPGAGPVALQGLPTDPVALGIGAPFSSAGNVELEFHWDDVAGADDYVVLSGHRASGQFHDRGGDRNLLLDRDRGSDPRRASSTTSVAYSRVNSTRTVKYTATGRPFWVAGL